MQLTWLPGAPSRPASVHQRAIGQVGLGSPATQLMRAVGLLGTAKGNEARMVQAGRIGFMTKFLLVLPLLVAPGCAPVPTDGGTGMAATDTAVMGRLVSSADAMDSARKECQNGEHWRFIPDPTPVAVVLTNLGDSVFYEDGLRTGDEPLPAIDQLVWQVEFHGVTQVTMAGVNAQGTQEPFPPPFVGRCVVKIRAMTGEVMGGPVRNTWATLSPAELATITPLATLAPYEGPGEDYSRQPYP